MLDLAIAIDADPEHGTIVETNHGVTLRALNWPHDCDFQVVAFDPGSENCEVIWTESLADDIRLALSALERMAATKGRKPGWYRRLELCAKRASSASRAARRQPNPSLTPGQLPRASVHGLFEPCHIRG